MSTRLMLEIAAIVISTGSADPTLIEGIIALTGASLLDDIKALPIVAASPGAYEAIVEAGKLAYTLAYRYVYYASIGKHDPANHVYTEY